jgi:hypothetical protein
MRIRLKDIGYLLTLTLALVAQSGPALQAGQGVSKGAKIARAASLLMLLRAAGHGCSCSQTCLSLSWMKRSAIILDP